MYVAEGSGEMQRVKTALAIASMLLVITAPFTARAFIQITYTPTFSATIGANTIYDGNPDDPLVPPPIFTVDGSTLPKPTNTWHVELLKPFTVHPDARFVVVLARVIQDGYGQTILDGAPALDQNYAVVTVPSSDLGISTSTFDISFSMPLFGDDATASSSYALFVGYIDDQKGAYDEASDTETYSAFSNEDVGSYLAQDDTFFNTYDVSVYWHEADFQYLAGIAQQRCTPQCESNVLFLPGIEGSRLYMKSGLLGSENQLWEPDWNSNQTDAQKLALNSNGASVNEVYTKSGQVIDTVRANVLGKEVDIEDVYASFLDQLAQMKASSTIADYLAFPYDWRASPKDVVEKGTPYEDGTHYLDQELISLASSSKTGKVTIVAHSNGGLVAKALMEKLQSEGKADLVDKIIFVDVPQLGTPQAVAGMLHGDGENIGLPYLSPGAIVSQSTARALGLTMPDAYALLPSAAYFNKVATPVADLTLAPGLRSGNGADTVIDNESSFAQFLTTGRTQPATSDIETPALLSNALLAQANTVHNELDNWTAPPGVQVIQIAGWGIDTPASIVYQEIPKTTCSTLGCTTSTTTRHSVLFTEDGDDTVVVPSQTAMSDSSVYYLAVSAYNKDTNSKFGHVNVFEMQPFETLFSQIMATSGALTTLPAYVTQDKPLPSSLNKGLRLRVLSPVTLDAYDSQGRHTGIAVNPNSGSDLQILEEQIPGSYYERFGEGQYIGLPASGDYTIVMHGTDTGTFTFQETPVVDGIEQQSATFSNIPVTASTTATLEISSNALTSSALALDFNGDGTVDTTVASSTQSQDPVEYTKLVLADIAGMGLGKPLDEQLQVKFTDIEHMLEQSNEWDGRDDDQPIEIKDKIGQLISRLRNQIDIHHDATTQGQVLQKLATIETYVEKQLKQSQTEEKHRVGERHHESEHVRPVLTPDQAAAIVSMIEDLRNLVTTP